MIQTTLHCNLFNSQLIFSKKILTNSRHIAFDHFAENRPNSIEKIGDWRLEIGDWRCAVILNLSAKICLFIFFTKEK